MTKYHFIGIGGIGMSSLARILHAKNHQVSGSDTRLSKVTKDLEKMGITIFPRQIKENISESMTVIFSTDIREENFEYQAAKKLGCKLMHRSRMLGHLIEETHSIAVTGTHGKTSTSALLSYVLFASGLDPSFSIGGILQQLGSNGRAGKGGYFVFEADESDGTFLNYHPMAAIVTNIGLDHMQHFFSVENLIKEFQQFIQQVQNKDLLFLCGDDHRLFAFCEFGITYGFSSHCKLRITNWQQSGWRTFCDICFEKKEYRNLELSMIGRHNALNAAVVFGLCLKLGIAEDKIRKAFKTFGGVCRRQEKKGEFKGALFVDDYAHHPTEIGATLQALRQAEPKKRLIAVFQPHRFSRTKECLNDFAKAFRLADEVIVTDIYAASELPNGTSAEDVQSKISTSVACCYLPFKDLASFLKETVAAKDLVVTLGAGDITTVAAKLIAEGKNGRKSLE